MISIQLFFYSCSSHQPTTTLNLYCTSLRQRPGLPRLSPPSHEGQGLSAIEMVDMSQVSETLRANIFDFKDESSWSRWSDDTHQLKLINRDDDPDLQDTPDDQHHLQDTSNNAHQLEHTDYAQHLQDTSDNAHQLQDTSDDAQHLQGTSVKTHQLEDTSDDGQHLQDTSDKCAST
ncbi:hypothetical protein AAMO2058_001651500 [Amorphochlora amoebiformis]